MSDWKCIVIWLGASVLASSTALAQAETPPAPAPAPAQDAPPQAESPQQPKQPDPQQAPEWARRAGTPQQARAPQEEPDAPPTTEAAPELPEAPPEPRVPFGSKGQWVVMGSSNHLDIARETYSNSLAKFFDASAEVGLDSFVVRNFSIGFDLSASYEKDQGYGATTLIETTSTLISAGARFGCNVPLGASFSWYPRLTLGLQSARGDTTYVSALIDAPFAPPSSASRIGPWLNFYAPLLAHPAPHFLVGFGPRVEHGFGVTRGGPYDGSQLTLVSAEFVVGGWWGGPPPERTHAEAEDSGVAEEGAARPADYVQRAFGAERQFVLTAATLASVASRFYSNSKGSNTSVTLAPGFDYFLVENVSVGVDSVIAYSKGTSLDSTGATTHANSTSIGLAPRLGVNIPLSRVLSLWPQAEVGYGTVDTNQISPSGANQHSKTRVWVELSTPLLVHAASHFFVGGGPTLLHELSDMDQYDYENDATSVGASLVLGGWV